MGSMGSAGNTPLATSYRVSKGTSEAQDMMSSQLQGSQTQGRLTASSATCCRENGDTVYVQEHDWQPVAGTGAHD